MCVCVRARQMKSHGRGCCVGSHAGDDVVVVFNGENAHVRKERGNKWGWEEMGSDWVIPLDLLRTGRGEGGREQVL